GGKFGRWGGPPSPPCVAGAPQFGWAGQPPPVPRQPLNIQPGVSYVRPASASTVWNSTPLPGGTIKAVPPPAFPQLRPRPSDPGAGSYAPTGSVTSEAALEEQLQAQARVAIMQLQSQDPEYDADPLLAPAQAAPKPPPDPVIMQGEIMSLVQKFGLDERIRVRLVDALTRRAATFWEVPAFDSESYVDCTKSSGIVVREAH
ncbi:unnamed protein product, partial [Symbiodinium microadriaticum]